MVVETTRDNICVNHLIGQKTENFIAEGDSIIPDIKPDIINEVCTSGTVCIYKKEINEGKVRLDGCVNSYIMYRADDENESIRGLNVNLFNEMKSSTSKDIKDIIKNIENNEYNFEELEKFKTKYMGKDYFNNTKKLVDFIFKYLDKDAKDEGIKEETYKHNKEKINA